MSWSGRVSTTGRRRRRAPSLFDRLLLHGRALRFLARELFLLLLDLLPLGVHQPGEGLKDLGGDGGGAPFEQFRGDFFRRGVGEPGLERRIQFFQGLLKPAHVQVEHRPVERRVVDVRRLHPDLLEGELLEVREKADDLTPIDHIHKFCTM